MENIVIALVVSVSGSVIVLVLVSRIYHRSKDLQRNITGPNYIYPLVFRINHAIISCIFNHAQQVELGECSSDFIFFLYFSFKT